MSSLFRGSSGRRGKDHELSQSQAGTATIVLNNADRRFDPSNMAGLYYPHVVPRTQVRIRAIHNGIAYPLFQGYVRDWGQQWSPRPLYGYGDAECVVSCVDAFGILSLFETVGGSVLADEILADSPETYWKLDEAAGSGTAADSGSSGATLTANGAQVTFDVDPSPLVGPAGTADFIAVGNTPLRRTGETFGLGVQFLFAAEFWIYVDAYPSAGNTAGIFSVNDGTATYGIATVLLREDGTLRYGMTSGGAEFDVTTTLVTVPLATWTYVAVTRSSTNVRWYLNGVYTELQTIGAVTADNPGAASVTMVVGAWEDEAAPYLDAKLGHVALYDGIGPDSNRIAVHYSARFQDQVNDTAGNQINAILDLIGWPSSMRSVDTDATVTQTALDLEGSALAEMLAIGEDTEQGLVQMSADGKVVFHTRQSLIEHSTVQATFGDLSSAVPYDDLRLRNDDQDYYARVIATRTGGTPQVAEIAVQAPPTLTKSGLRFISDSDSLDFALFQLSRYSSFRTRPSSVHFPGATDANWPSLLARDTHYDKVEIRRTPPGGGSGEIRLGAHIEGISWAIVPGTSFELTYSLTPAFEEAYWVLDVSAFDTETVLAW